MAGKSEKSEKKGVELQICNFLYMSPYLTPWQLINIEGHPNFSIAE
jgi:hypothetical protein